MLLLQDELKKNIYIISLTKNNINKFYFNKMNGSFNYVIINK